MVDQGMLSILTNSKILNYRLIYRDILREGKDVYAARIQSHDPGILFLYLVYKRPDSSSHFHRGMKRILPRALYQDIVSSFS